MSRDYMKGKSSLAEICPDIASQWHPTRNGNLSPKDVSSGSSKKVWWQCDKGHEWEVTTSHRTRKDRAKKRGCPFCANRKIDGQNCLSVTHPDIAEKWNFDKNGSITPDMVVAGSSGKKYWWKCSVAKDHSWLDDIPHRIINKGCPFCSGHRVAKSTCLATTHPDLAKDWHSKNKQLTPSDVSAGSGLKVWWQCRNNKDHVWQAVIGDRANHGNGCPICKESKGELRISQFLKSRSIVHEKEVRFESCRNIRPLPFDFVIMDCDIPKKVIEFQGIQHYEPTDFHGSKRDIKERFERVKVNDAIKRKWCQDNDVELLEIPYWELEKVEQIVGDFICTIP